MASNDYRGGGGGGITPSDYGAGSAHEMRIPVPPGTAEMVITAGGWGDAGRAGHIPLRPGADNYVIGGHFADSRPVDMREYRRQIRRQQIVARARRGLETAAFVFLSWFGVTLAIKIVKTWLL